MSVFEEVREYARCWTNSTGHRPTAVPLTPEECAALAAEFLCDEQPYRKRDPDAVSTILGMDIYMTPDAKQRRDLIMTI